MESDIVKQPKNQDILAMTASIVSSFVSNNPVHASSLPDLIKSVHDSLNAISQPKQDMPQRPEPAVPINKSITPDYLVCLEDGRKLKMLKRYLRSRYDLTPEEYRLRWGLASDYPMVAPNYAKRRSDFAKEIGLGRKRDDVA
ncbi:MAG: MucR family transcriptional regulator [Pseudomonadota bacterium]